VAEDRRTGETGTCSKHLIARTVIIGCFMTCSQLLQPRLTESQQVRCPQTRYCIGLRVIKKTI